MASAKAVSISATKGSVMIALTTFINLGTGPRFSHVSKNHRIPATTKNTATSTNPEMKPCIMALKI